MKSLSSVGLNFVGWFWGNTTGNWRWSITNMNNNKQELQRAWEGQVCATEQNLHISSLLHCPVRAGRKLTEPGKKGNLTCKSLSSPSIWPMWFGTLYKTLSAYWHSQFGFSHRAHPNQALPAAADLPGICAVGNVPVLPREWGGKPLHQLCVWGLCE